MESQQKVLKWPRLDF